jgi:hypothetical protein
MSLNQLTPEQIVFINAINNALIKTYEDVIKDKGISFEQELPMIGTVKAFRKLDDEQIKEIINNKRFNFAKQLQNLIDPIAEIIKESTPEIYEEAYELAGMNRPNDDDDSDDSLF